MNLHLSHWAAPLRSNWPPLATPKAALYHRLTGQPAAATPDIIKLLWEAGPTQTWHIAELACEPRIKPLLDPMVAAGLLEPAARSNPLESFASWRVAHPIRCPALMYFDRVETSLRVYRPQDLSVCRLPRTDAVPVIVRERLSPLASALSLSLAGHPTLRSLQQQLRRTGFSDDDVLHALSELTHPDRQLIRLVPPWQDPQDPCADFQFPMQSFVAAEVDDVVGVSSAASFYLSEVDKTSSNFDWVEPTMAHAFRAPTRALGGLTYGARLCESFLPILQRQAASNGSLRVLEIGGGLGHMARGFLQRLNDAGLAEVTSYTILDLSHTLQQVQRCTLCTRRVNYAAGDAQEWLPDGQYDLIVANEVVADFELRLDTGSGQPRWRQTGAHALIAQLPTHLRRGGVAVIIEYGAENRPPERMVHLNHSEFSVDFGELAREARERHALAACVLPMSRLLRPVGSALLLLGQQERYECLRQFACDRGSNMQFRAQDCDDPELQWLPAPPDRLTPLIAPFDLGLYFGPDLRQFQALILSRELSLQGIGDSIP